MKRNWFTLLVILIVVFALGSILFFVKHSRNQSNTQHTLIDENIADWVTYTTKLGFSFRYPKDYRVYEKVPGFFVISSLNNKNIYSGISIEARVTSPFDRYQDAVGYFYNNFIQSDVHSINDLTDDSIDKKVNWVVFNGVGKEGQLKGMSFLVAYKQFKDGIIKLETLETSETAKYFDDVVSSFNFTEKYY